MTPAPSGAHWPTCLLQISIVKKGKHESRERARELFRELASLQVPWEALGAGFCSRRVNLVWKKAHTLLRGQRNRLVILAQDVRARNDLPRCDGLLRGESAVGMGLKVCDVGCCDFR
jgi:hypothetical protein